MASSSRPHTIPELIYISPTSSTPAQEPTGAANISIREYIYFLPHPLPPKTPIPYTPGLPSINPLELSSTPLEPTSTLVLTTPRKAFVDLRYLKPTSPSESALPNHGEAHRLDWGFAGVSHSTPAKPAHDTDTAFNHASWTHWLDSRVPINEPIPPDHGDMYDLGEGLFLEHGHAWHPHLGRVAGHEELWRDVEPQATHNEEGGKVCVLLRCHDEGERVRGVVVRVGRFCQGILQRGAECTTERWEFDAGRVPDEESTVDGLECVRQDNGWKRTARTGDAFVPCTATFRTEIVQLGGRVRYGGLEWVVEEAWVWK
ncbi:hypothetical protein N0V86_002713 [Didymella sp. IMI 355093]|nr:hypothetical protein N0V86_002713 [Didymella sp. IMI 355093]